MRAPHVVPGLAVCALLTMTGCTADSGGHVPDGALLALADDVDLGIAMAGGGELEQVALDSSGAPVLLSSTEFAGQAGLTRGTDLSTRALVDALGADGLVAEMAVDPDDVVVLLGGAGAGAVPSVIRVSPDGAEQVVPLDLPEGVDASGADNPVRGTGTDFSPDASRLVLTDVGTGTLQVTLVDTATGTADGVAQVPLAADEDPAGPPIRVDDVVVTDDGDVLVAVALGGRDSRLLRFDAELDPVSSTPYDRAADGSDTFLAVDDDGDAYLTQTAAGVQLLRVPAGADEAEVVAELSEDIGSVDGLAVDAAGRWAYATGLYDGDAGKDLTAVDLASGAVTPRTGYCDQGSSGGPLISPAGDSLVVSAACSDGTLFQEHLYVFRGA